MLRHHLNGRWSTAVTEPRPRASRNAPVRPGAADPSGRASPEVFTEKPPTNPNRCHSLDHRCRGVRMAGCVAQRTAFCLTLGAWCRSCGCAVTAYLCRICFLPTPAHNSKVAEGRASGAASRRSVKEILAYAIPLVREGRKLCGKRQACRTRRDC